MQKHLLLLAAFVLFSSLLPAPNLQAQTNTKTGEGALVSNTPSGIYNTATGYRALHANTYGSWNSAHGAYALASNTNGFENTATGYFALYSNTRGWDNTATGTYALLRNIEGKWNTATGICALQFNRDGSSNTAHGAFALQYDSLGYANTAMGYSALSGNNGGIFNTAMGYDALRNNANELSRNTAVGASALLLNSGSENTAVGYDALAVYPNYGNTAVGTDALATGAISYNTAIGLRAGSGGGLGRISYSNSCTYIGTFSGPVYHYGKVDYFSNSMAIGYGVTIDASNQIRIGNQVINSIMGAVNWSAISDSRYKRNIREDVPGLAFINQLRPVTYNLDVNGIANKLNAGRQSSVADGNEMARANAQAEAEQQKARAEKSKITYTGFVAQEVEDAAKKLNYDFSGVDAPKDKDGLYGLRYSEFVVPLVKAVQELSKENDQLKQDVIELKEMVNKLLKGQSIHTGILNTTSGAYLEQNAPNPFSSATVIRYHLPANTGNAQLLITGINGQTLRSFTLRNGDSQLTLNAGTLAAGTYNYSLMVDGRKADNKQLVITR